MPSRALPRAAQTQLEPLLANGELALAAIATGPTHDVEEVAGFMVVNDHRARARLQVALTAAARITEIIGVLPWPAIDRRDTVEYWHDHVRRLCDIEPDHFVAERRQQAWWLDFQRSLAHDTPARAFARWLVAAMEARPMTVPELAPHLDVSDRMIWDWRAGRSLPRRRAVIMKLRQIFGTTFTEIAWIFKLQSPRPETSVPQNRTKHSGKTRKRR